jgi:hypothetical protein
MIMFNKIMHIDSVYTGDAHGVEDVKSVLQARKEHFWGQRQATYMAIRRKTDYRQQMLAMERLNTNQPIKPAYSRPSKFIKTQVRRRHVGEQRDKSTSGHSSDSDDASADGEKGDSDTGSDSEASKEADQSESASVGPTQPLVESGSELTSTDQLVEQPADLWMSALSPKIKPSLKNAMKAIAKQDQEEGTPFSVVFTLHLSSPFTPMTLSLRSHPLFISPLL